jgi:hypothetical protein
MGCVKARKEESKNYDSVLVRSESTGRAGMNIIHLKCDEWIASPKSKRCFHSCCCGVSFRPAFCIREAIIALLVMRLLIAKCVRQSVTLLYVGR